MKNKRVYGELVVNPVAEYGTRYRDNIIESNARHHGLYIGKDDALDNLFNIMTDRSLIDGKEDQIAERVIETIRYDDTAWSDIYNSMDYNAIEALLESVVYPQLDLNNNDVKWMLEDAIRTYIRNDGVTYDNIQAIINSKEELVLPDNTEYAERYRLYLEIFDKNNPFTKCKARIVRPEDIKEYNEYAIHSRYRYIFNDYKYAEDVVEYAISLQDIVYDKLRSNVYITEAFRDIEAMIADKFGGKYE